LNCEEFANLAKARWFARRRQHEHNHERPHSSLDYQTPHNSSPRVLLPLRLSLRSSSTRQEQKTKKPGYLLPNPYSITAGTEIGGIPLGLAPTGHNGQIFYTFADSSAAFGKAWLPIK
jgi:hypothetical protein